MRNEAEARFPQAAEAAPAGTFVPITFSKLTTRKFGTLLHLACLVIVSLACVMSAYAQGGQTTGAVRGIVTDTTGALVAGAKVTISSKTSNYRAETTSTSEGEYRFSDLIPGDYNIAIEAQNFKTLTLSDVRVELGRVADVPAQLQAGAITETVNVSAGGAELVETTTTQLSKSFNERQVVELAQTNVGGAFGGGVNNLALLAANVTSSGGVGVGTGGSVGGQRPRNNNFMVDGVDNNDKSVTGPQTYVSPENVAEFSLIQNQFSAEYGRSNGGQFITITKSGTNDYHGSFYGFFRNRYLNALDTAQKEDFVRESPPPAGKQFMPRSDFFRGGANIGGPLHLPRFGEGPKSYYRGQDRLFFYAAYERLQQGLAAAAAGLTAPTAAGFALLNAQPGVSPTNLAILNTYVPAAAAANREPLQFCRVIRDATSQCPDPTPGTDANENILLVPRGSISFPAPNFLKQNNVVTNVDYNQSTNTTHRFRFNLTNNIAINTNANLPFFFANVPNKQRLFSYSLFHTFTSNLSNETRLAYRRSEQNFPLPASLPAYPGLDIFPNIGLQDLAVDIGPDPNTPQTGIENNYQIVNNTTYLWGNHSLRFGGDFRKVISPQRFVQRERGDYQYTATDLFLHDVTPDFLAQRNVGASTYYGDQKILYAFFQDDWRIRPNVTLNLGLGYSYQQIPVGTKQQALNAAASVPGLIEFREPRSQTKNFAPKFGIVWSPNFTEGMLGRVFGSNGKTSIRAGFSMAYDYVFDNLYILSPPPQAQQTIDDLFDPDDPNSFNYLARGGIPNTGTGVTFADVFEQRAATASFITDQEVPYSLTWTLSIQRQFKTNWSVELRYLGTRGIHLLTQNRLNIQPTVGPFVGAGLPTFFTEPTQAQVNALALDLADIQARNPIVPAFDAAGFNGNFLVGFLPNGNSTYHGGSAQLIRRFADGVQATAAYTWSHLIDDTTAEVFSTVLSPRRVEDFYNLRKDRADSALDRRHRFVLSAIYELPFFRNHENKFVRAVFGGFNFAGTYTAESGQKATVLSGIDSNGNLDAASDRTIINTSGTRDTSSTVRALLRTCAPANVTAGGGCSETAASRTVGYVANTADAQYIQAGAGVISNAARNTLQLPGINNLDFSIFKNFRFGETKRIQLRADLFNAFNHPQYIPGSPNDVTPISTVGVANVNTVGRAEFNRPDRVFSSNPRVIQMALRFDF
jgi:Carboxypeptidase regulatory-like domain